ncbi:hypothetical protein BDP27DRAFT_602668 [Rhodocollybia butyracea]|uniref:Uncharacterized protein n=1 Tax=Rhodocollybia butyracea TaxID=206335 RepID=A0A9P5UFG4_9AGAR|nr:hypothetical protein BDP27DRAFT_602668 [Rhodocollybia butyracea]
MIQQEPKGHSAVTPEYEWFCPNTLPLLFRGLSQLRSLPSLRESSSLPELVQGPAVSFMGPQAVLCGRLGRVSIYLSTQSFSKIMNIMLWPSIPKKGRSREENCQSFTIKPHLHRCTILAQNLLAYLITDTFNQKVSISLIPETAFGSNFTPYQSLVFEES